MVPTVSKTRDDKSSQEGLGLVVELLGPAAAGKSSLIQALTQSNGSFEVEVGLRTRKIGHLPYFVSNALMLLPTFLRQYGNDRWFTWEEIKMLVYLRGWHHVLRRRAMDGATIHLENGPVFKLTRLHAFGPENMRRQNFDRWWAGMFKQWASILDMVIWLDAPDEILIERVYARGRWHEIMDKDGKERIEFLARYRRSYALIIPKLLASDGVRLMRLESDHQSLSQMRDKVLAAYKFGNGQGGASQRKPVDSEEART